MKLKNEKLENLCRALQKARKEATDKLEMVGILVVVVAVAVAGGGVKYRSRLTLLRIRIVSLVLKDN